MSMSMFESELRDAERGRRFPNHGRLASFAKASAGQGKPPLLGSEVIAGMFMAIFEGELGDTRFIELAQSFCDHAIILILGRAREW
jgi:hypothetical protein